MARYRISTKKPSRKVLPIYKYHVNGVVTISSTDRGDTFTENGVKFVRCREPKVILR
jgi:hypothetical protein